MDVSYNLRYQKHNFSNRLILDKEGEIVIYGKGFRLKGKGANDKGELINFSEIKEFYYKNDKIIFITFIKEKYVLSETGTLFEHLLIDLYKSRNEFLMDALFMKDGKLKAEFEANFERTSKFGKMINKGRAKLRLYERSLVVIPQKQDAFSIYYDFVNFYEFDELDYFLKIIMDDGLTVIFSQLGDDYEFFQEKMDDLLGGMYETLVNDQLKEAFPQFHVATLLKLAYKMKGGKAVSLKEINKIDKELAGDIDKFIYEDPAFAEKVKNLRDTAGEEGTYYGIAKDETMKDGYVKWVMFCLPESNIVAFSILPRWKGNTSESPHLDYNDTFFYKIIMEKGNPEEKKDDKIREIDQSLVTLNFAKDPCYKDKRELKHSPYQYAIRKLPYLRILRKSYVGKASATDIAEWKKQTEDIIKTSKLQG